MIADSDAAVDASEAWALIAEARRRHRRRRRRRLLALVVVAASIAAAVVALAGPGRAGTRAGERPRPARPVPLTRGASAAVAWWDQYSGGLMVGNLAAGRRVQVAATDPADIPEAVVQAHGRILWATAGGEVRSVALATGMTVTVGRGQDVFASPGGTILYLATDSRHLTEYAAGNLRPLRRLALPAGWVASAPWSLAV
ncbi:MAG: hypothetical protein ACYCUG_12735, partial [Acidimicrobiales bacterium]